MLILATGSWSVVKTMFVFVVIRRLKLVFGGSSFWVFELMVHEEEDEY